MPVGKNNHFYAKIKRDMLIYYESDHRLIISKLEL